jgi:hypothetical protein
MEFRCWGNLEKNRKSDVMADEMSQKRALITQPSERVAEAPIKRLIYKTVKMRGSSDVGNERIDI